MKPSAPALLRRELAKKSYKPGPIQFAGDTDIYCFQSTTTASLPAGVPVSDFGTLSMGAAVASSSDQVTVTAGANAVTRVGINAVAAAAGWTDAEFNVFGDGGIPQQVGGEPYWDKAGRWVGVCVSGFGICYNPEALARLGIERPPTRWDDLADARFAGHLALADPSKSGSANKAFEMLIQQRMSETFARRGSPARGSAAESAALAEGFDDGLRLVRRIGGSARYFTDQAGKVVQDVQNGSAAAGMCIDFYGRFESTTTGPGSRVRFVLPHGGSSMGADPIGLLRGAPNVEEAKAFIDFVLSDAGQSLFAYKRGVPGGPERYAMRRAPILPAMFEPSRLALRSDPQDNPYETARDFTYHGSWTGPLFRALSFVIRVMCVDTEVELHEAAATLAENGNPPEAKAAFDDMSLVSYLTVKNDIAPTLASGDPLREVALQNRLVKALKAHYEHVTELARQKR